MSSLSLLPIFYIVGVNLLFARKVFSIGRNLRYVIAGLLFFSVALAFVTRGRGFPWGGAVGDMISDRLTMWLGWVGTAALLLVAGLAYFIWRFNPVFKMPALPVRDKGLTPVEVGAGGRYGRKEDSREARKGKAKEGGGGKLFVDGGFTNMEGHGL